MRTQVVKSSEINAVIDKFNHLPLEEKDLAFEIIRKTLAEANREAIYKRTRKAAENLQKGKVKRGNSIKLFNDMEND